MSSINKDILIDVTRLVGRFMDGRLPTGVDRVSLAYIAHYQDRARAVVRWLGRSFILSESGSQAVFDGLLAVDNPSAIAWRAILGRGMVGGDLSLGTARNHFLFNTGHSGLEDPRYPALVRQMEVRPLFLVHDLIPLSHPEYCRPKERGRHAQRMNAALSLASGIITNSAATLQDFSRYADSVGMALPPSVVALLAPGMNEWPVGEPPVKKPYFVMLGTIEPRKNHWLILQLWRRLIEQFGEAAPQLVVIGQRGWECENVVDLLERCVVLRGFVHEISACSDPELVSYLAHSQALLFPSFAEGYGMPVAEALSYGVPVIASDLPVFREIAGNIPEYVDPLDGRAWMDMISAYSENNSSLRAAQLARLSSFRAPQWSSHFERVDALLDQLRSGADA